MRPRPFLLLLAGFALALMAGDADADWSMDTDLSDASSSFIGEDGDDESGWAVAGAGDVNGDGYDDFIIGADGDDDGGTNAGQTYLILGKASGWAMDTDLSNADASFWGEDFDDLSGSSVSGAGDVNGDGYDDFLIGAHYNDDGGSNAGQTYLILGKASGWAMDTDLSDADASFRGEDVDDESGFAVSGVGDVNGDGYDDCLISARGDDDGGSGAGQTYLILGKASGWAMDTDLSDADASFWGEDAADHSGWVASGAGDVNGDGYDDFLIGAYGDDDGGSAAGQTYLILGKASGWAMDTDLSDADASFWGEDAGDYSGRAVSGVGDVNGDGYDDFLIGAFFDNYSGTDAGQTYLILGKASGWAMGTDLSDADASFWGEDAFDRSGFAVSGVGDVNNDGYDDFLIGAYNAQANGGDRAGQTYLILGKFSGWSMDTNLSTANASFWGEDDGDGSGRAVSGAGDVNGDGYDDFLIGSLYNGDGGSQAGQTYLILGKDSSTGDPELEVDAGTTSRNVAPGKSVSYTLTVYNSGSGDDDVLLSTAFTIDGWTAELYEEEFFLAAGDSHSVQLTVTASSSASDGEEDNTVVTAQAESDSSIHDSMEFSTTVVVPAPDWSFSLVAQPNDDWDGTYYLVRDRAPITVTLTLTNQGNQNTDFSLQTLVSPVGAFSATVQPSYFSSVAPGDSEQVEVQITVMDDFLGSTGVVTVEASGGGSEVERADLDLRLEQSGSLNLGTSSLRLSAERSGSAHHPLMVANSGPPMQVYFAVSGLTTAEAWVSFLDREGSPITGDSPQAMLLLLDTDQVTLEVAVPASGEVGDYVLEVWMVNQEHKRISEKHTFTVEVVNEPPVATLLVSPNPAKVGEIVQFTGNGSDVDGTIVAYQWNSSIDGELSTEADFSTSVLSLGHHTITFRVQDDNEEWSNADSESLYIGIPPVAIAGGVVTVEAGKMVQFFGQGGDDDGSIALYEWDFDGNGIYDWSSEDNGIAEFRYSSEGIYNAVLKVTDNDGFSSTTTMTISVEPASRTGQIAEIEGKYIIGAALLIAIGIATAGYLIRVR